MILSLLWLEEQRMKRRWRRGWSVITLVHFSFGSPFQLLITRDHFPFVLLFTYGSRSCPWLQIKSLNRPDSKPLLRDSTQSAWRTKNEEEMLFSLLLLEEQRMKRVCDFPYCGLLGKDKAGYHRARHLLRTKWRGGENKEGSTIEIYIFTFCAFVLEWNASIGLVCLFFSTGRRLWIRTNLPWNPGWCHLRS